MTEELVSFELAKLAKEIGFRMQTTPFGFVTKYYHPRTGTLLTHGRTGRTKYSDLIYAPTLSLLQRWFREKHNIDVLPTMSRNSRTYGYRIFCIEEGKTIVYVHIYKKHETFEEAFEAGLIEGLKLIK